MVRVQWGLGVAGAAVAAVLGVFGLSGSSSMPALLEPSAFVHPSPELAWTQRVALVDEALARGDLSHATHEWRDAYGAALRSRRWDALVEVGDRAVRIAEVAGGSTHFRAEARQAYLNALFRARAQRAVEGMHRAAAAFERLGDSEMAQGARRLAGNLS